MEKIRSASLCETCKWVKKISNKNGSTFFLCQIHKEDPSFPKYPRQPVWICTKYLKENITSQK